jgi:hypothetical protein
MFFAALTTFCHSVLHAFNRIPLKTAVFWNIFFFFEQTSGVLGASFPLVHKTVVEVYKQNLEFAVLYQVLKFKNHGVKDRLSKKNHVMMDHVSN